MKLSLPRKLVCVGALLVLFVAGGALALHRAPAIGAQTARSHAVSLGHEVSFAQSVRTLEQAGSLSQAPAGLLLQNSSRPVIKSVTAQSSSTHTQMLRITVENLPGSYQVLVNGSVQSALVLLEPNVLGLKLSAAQFARSEKLEFVVADAANSSVRSSPFTLANENYKESVVPINGSTEFLENGYLVAHAFGACNGATYTNSLEAFRENYKKGHRLFEVDFQLTSDNVLIGMHDRPERLGTFAQEQAASKYTLVSFDEICDLMLEHPDMYIITDTKYDKNYSAISAIFDYMARVIEEKDPTLYDRIVVQFYNQSMYQFLKQHYDFTSYIYTLYVSPDSNAEVLSFVRQEKIKAVTMWGDRATWNFVSQLNDLGTCVFTHTINSAAQAQNMLNMGVFGIYTDSLSYEDLSFTKEGRYRSWAAQYAKAPAVSSENPTTVQNRLAFLDYLKDLRRIREDYVIIISAKDEASTAITDEVQNQLYRLGLQRSLQDKYRCSYLAVLDGGKPIFEACAPEKIECNLMLDNCVVHAVSAGWATGDTSEIQIDGAEYSTGKRGLNIVLYHKLTGQVVESVCFDTYSAYQKYSK